MTSSIFFFLFVPLLAFILLAVNFILAPHNPYQEKNGAFECGFTSFLGQNRTQFSISFFIFALLFLLFDLEILLVYPYLVSSYINETYGLVILLVFLLALTLGFVFELGKKALSIDSRQTIQNKNDGLSISMAMIISSQDIIKNVITYVVRYIYNEMITCLYLILKPYMKRLLYRLTDLFTIIWSLVNKQSFIVYLNIQVVSACLITLLYSSYYGCVSEYTYILSASFITVAISLYITFSKNFKTKYPILHKYLEIFLIICLIIPSLYLLFSIPIRHYDEVRIKHKSGNTNTGSGEGGNGNNGGNGGGNGGPNGPEGPFGVNETSKKRNTNEDEPDINATDSKSCDKRYYYANRERISEKRRINRALNRDSINKATKERRGKDDNYKKTQGKYYEKNRIAIIQRVIERRKSQKK